MFSLENLMLLILASNVLVVTVALIVVVRMYMRHSAIKRFYRTALTFSNGRTLPGDTIPNRFIIAIGEDRMRYDLDAIVAWLVDNNFKGTIATAHSSEATNLFPIMVPNVKPVITDIVEWNYTVEPGIYTEPKWKQ